MARMLAITATFAALAVAPALAVGPADNPGTGYQESYQPEGTPDQTANPGTPYAEAAPYDAETAPGDDYAADAPYTGDDNPGAEYSSDAPYGGDANPGTQYRDGAPYSGDANPGLQRGPSRRAARALAREHCSEFTANFKQNRSAFGKCVAAVAKAVRNRSLSARVVCDAADLTRKRLDGRRRSDFRACVLAAASARRDAER